MPRSFPRPASGVTTELVAALHRLGQSSWRGTARCVGETPDLRPYARECDDAIAGVAERLISGTTAGVTVLVVIRPFNLCMVPYRFRGANALPWSLKSDDVFTDGDTIHPLGAQLSARGARVASVQFFGPDAPDPHDLRPRLAIGALQVPTWTPATPLSYE